MEKQAANQGRVVRIGKFDAYVVLPADVGKNSPIKGGVVLSSDIYGFEMAGTRLCAELIAKESYACVLPDQFDGKPLTRETMSQLHDWWQSNDPQGDVVQKIVLDSAKYLQTTHSIASVSLVGICFGGKVMLKALKDMDILKVGIAVHGSRMLPEELVHLTKPCLLIWAENDDTYPLKPFKEQLEYLSEKKNTNTLCKGNFRLEVVPNAPHGFYSKDDPELKEQKMMAHSFIAKWLNKFH